MRLMVLVSLPYTGRLYAQRFLLNLSHTGGHTVGYTYLHTQGGIQEGYTSLHTHTGRHIGRVTLYTPTQGGI